jgi:hypothetical protein
MNLFRNTQLADAFQGIVPNIRETRFYFYTVVFHHIVRQNKMTVNQKVKHLETICFRQD